MDLFKSLAFWLTVLAITIWLTLSALKFYIKNTMDENRVQVLQELGIVNIQQPSFVGFFHPYW